MSQALYNTRHLAKPPSSSLKAVTGLDSAVFVKVKSKLQNCINVLSTSSDLATEHHVLKRLLFRKKNQIRRQKILQSLSQVAKFIERFMETKLGDYASEMLSAFEEDLCPSRQMLEYMLVRLMGVAVLLAEANNYCLKTFLELYQQLETGHLVPQNLIFLSALSRIRLMVCALFLHVVDWYDSLVGSLQHLTPAAYVWLPGDYVFPPQLSDWVNSITPVPTSASQEQQASQSQQISQQQQVGLQQQVSLPQQRPTKRVKSLVARMLEKFAENPSKGASPDQTEDGLLGEDTSRLSTLDSSIGEAVHGKGEDRFSQISLGDTDTGADSHWKIVRRDPGESFPQLGLGDPDSGDDSKREFVSGLDSTVGSFKKVKVSKKKRKTLKEKLLQKKQQLAKQKRKMKEDVGLEGDAEHYPTMDKNGNKKKKKELLASKGLFLSPDSSGAQDSLNQKKKKKKVKREGGVEKSCEGDSNVHTSGLLESVGERAGVKAAKKKKKFLKQKDSSKDSTSSLHLLKNPRKMTEMRLSKKVKKLMKLKGLDSDFSPSPPHTFKTAENATGKKMSKRMKKLMKLKGSLRDFGSSKRDSSLLKTDDALNHTLMKQKKKKKQRQKKVDSSDRSSSSLQTNGRKKKRGKKRKAVSDGPKTNKKMRYNS